MKSYIIKISGIVQSVGFRPYIYRLFNKHSGWVRNTQEGVLIYVEGRIEGDIKQLIKDNAPHNAKIDRIVIKSFDIKKRAFKKFSIKDTDTTYSIDASLIPPDLGVCEECAKELFDDNNRRFLHPFINCTNCGPRFSMITGLPYDREKTTMKDFKMCSYCQNEYKNPMDRRFHAQPIACNQCGPSYFLLENGRLILQDIDAIKYSALFLENGSVILLKGIGGYHLVCDGFNSFAVNKIQKIKQREKKPFAVIAKDMKTIKRYCYVDSKEEELLLSQIKPIVLLRIKDNDFLSNVRKESGYLGVMLPYAPIHHLLFYCSNLELLVATSANSTDKPLIYNDIDAVKFEYCDYILTNNRRIQRPIEDSIVLSVNSRDVIYRFARGFAPGVFYKKVRPNILSLGADMKNNIAISLKNRIILSQYTGDLSEYENFQRFQEKVDDFLKFFNFKPDCVVCDKHPDYFSTNYAMDNFQNVKTVQHHKAHFASVLLEHSLSDSVIGVIMDGTGYGDDSAVWGGEFFVKQKNVIERVGHIDYMPFAFGESAIKEPYRLAMLWLLNIFGYKAFDHTLFNRYQSIAGVLKSIKTADTSSAGRLFDAASALLDIKTTAAYEAEASISLMYKAQQEETGDRFEYDLNGYNIDFKPTLEAMFDLFNKPQKGLYAAMFHNTFIDAIVKNIVNISRDTGIKTAALSGGVFQNEIVLSGAYKGLAKFDINVYFNNSIPINDGNIAIGQIYLASNL